MKWPRNRTTLTDTCGVVARREGLWWDKTTPPALHHHGLIHRRRNGTGEASGSEPRHVPLPRPRALETGKNGGRGVLECVHEHDCEGIAPDLRPRQAHGADPAAQGGNEGEDTRITVAVRPHQTSVVGAQSGGRQGEKVDKINGGD